MFESGTESPGAGTYGALAAISSLGSGWTSGGLLNPATGLGASALRGLAAASLRLQSLALGQQIIGQKLAFAQQQAAAQFVAGEKPYLVTQPVITPQTQKLAAAVIKLESARKPHAAKIAATHLANVQSRLAPQASYFYAATYGPNNGPPVAGSRDDPGGAYFPGRYA